MSFSLRDCWRSLLFVLYVIKNEKIFEMNQPKFDGIVLTKKKWVNEYKFISVFKQKIVLKEHKVIDVFCHSLLFNGALFSKLW